MDCERLVEGFHCLVPLAKCGIGFAGRDEGITVLGIFAHHRFRFRGNGGAFPSPNEDVGAEYPHVRGRASSRKDLVGIGKRLVAPAERRVSARTP